MIFVQAYFYPEVPRDFLGPAFHYMSWALSLLQLKKFGYRVHLHTDQPGKEILLDRLQLSYDQVMVQEPDFDKSYFQTSCKITVCRSQKEPFVFIDGDLFLWEPIPKESLRADLICQNLELDSLDMWCYNQRLAKLGIELKPENETIHTGVLGFQNSKHISKYAESLFAFLKENRERFKDPHFFAACSEPYFAYRYAKENNLSIGTLLKYQVYKGYQNLGDFSNRPFSHMMGKCKKDERNCRQLEEYVKTNYPAVYKRIKQYVQ